MNGEPWVDDRYHWAARIAPIARPLYRQAWAEADGDKDKVLANYERLVREAAKDPEFVSRLRSAAGQ